MGENVKRTAEKLSSSKKVDEAREAELRAAEELAAFEEKLNQLLPVSYTHLTLPTIA